MAANWTFVRKEAAADLFRYLPSPETAYVKEETMNPEAGGEF